MTKQLPNNRRTLHLRNEINGKTNHMQPKWRGFIRSSNTTTYQPYGAQHTDNRNVISDLERCKSIHDGAAWARFIYCFASLSDRAPCTTLLKLNWNEYVWLYADRVQNYEHTSTESYKVYSSWGGGGGRRKVGRRQTGIVYMRWASQKASDYTWYYFECYAWHSRADCALFPASIEFLPGLFHLYSIDRRSNEQYLFPFGIGA